MHAPERCPVAFPLMAGSDSTRRAIEWTGERCVPWADDVQMIYEHYHRYALAARFAAGKRVLDLASGEGYGAAMLAATATEVVGVDLDEPTVRHARQTYADIGNLRFEQGSITDRELLDGDGTGDGDGEFDVITCFEAIEHVREQHELLRLVRSRLAEGGVFLVSTPDVRVYTHEHGNDNPFHVKELTEDEFRALLGEFFGTVRMLRQNVAVGSVLTSGGEPGPVLEQSLRRVSEKDWTVGDGSPHTYLLALASDGALDDIPALGTLLDPELNLLGSAAQRLAPRLAEAETELNLLRAERAELAAEVAELRRQSELDAAKLAWRTETAERFGAEAARLAEENARLSEGYSPSVNRLVGRYRAAVEKAAPRASRRRGAFERAVGRSTVAPPAIELEPIGVTTSDEPLVSIVIPVHGQWAYTRRCLAAIEAGGPRVPFEVIVVDDASPDDSARVLARCPGVRLVRAEHNLGFVGASNLGAAQARGELLVLLNNDTEPRAGWLDALVETVYGDERIGLVGAKLLYPDGSLQECGGIVWSDASAANYGHGDDPDDPRYASLRDVDYCSGAALLVRRELFERLGGFDERYAPAYYEDTDLAFAVRAAGYRTVVEPAAVVVHHEGVSHGTDPSSGHKRFQETNRAVFAEKWADALKEQIAGPGKAALWVARQRMPGMVPREHGLVLIADLQVPTPDKDSGSVRMRRLVDALLALGQRVVFCPMDDIHPAHYTERLRRAGVTVLGDPAQRERFLAEAGSELRLVLLSRPTVAWHMAERIRICAPQAVLAYDTVDLHFVRLSRESELVRSLGDATTAAMLRQRAELYRELELALVRSSDRTLVVSESERDLLAGLAPEARVEVLSNVHPFSSEQTSPEGRSGALFVGSFEHAPNRDAAFWLAGEVWPAVRQRCPWAELELVGEDPTGEIHALEGDGVLVRGWVENLEEKYATARMGLAPLRFGSGVKGKVGESLAYGVPVVGTPLAFEGMRLRDGEEILSGETTEEIAERIATLFTDDPLWQRLSEAGRTAVGAQFGPEVARTALNALLSAQAGEGLAGT
jgi:GT2 family glycosyltransferase/2-polyprenyl-3-methyl-5-hydroxy-6-metoxy-1,4-benzoquinol methylase/glycosyltransferase involved in cell wall biosynthesis